MERSWYSARLLYEAPDPEHPERSLFRESIVVFEADEDEAAERAATLGRQTSGQSAASDADGPAWVFRSVDGLQSLGAESPRDGSEVFSRVSEPSAQEARAPRFDILRQAIGPIVAIACAAAVVFVISKSSGSDETTTDTSPLVFEPSASVSAKPSPRRTASPRPRTPTPTLVPTPTGPTPTAAPNTLPAVAGEAVVTESGLRYIDLVLGSGAQPGLDDQVQIWYSGWLDPTGEIVDSNLDEGIPDVFRMQGMILGFQEGLSGMREGGQRRLVIPAELGYGHQGYGPIPPDAVVIYDVELLLVIPTSE